VGRGVAELIDLIDGAGQYLAVPDQHGAEGPGGLLAALTLPMARRMDSSRYLPLSFSLFIESFSLVKNQLPR
jgi:hypothetical protein